MKKIKQILATMWMAGLICFFLGMSTKATAQVPVPVQAKKHDSLVYIKMKINGMACPFCAYGLEKRIKKIDGAANLSVNINKGYAIFSTPDNKKPTEKTLKKRVKEAGFTVEKITYSSESFHKKKIKK